MSYSSVFENDVDDTTSVGSVKTIIFNPTMSFHTFQRNRSWSQFPPPHTPPPEIVAQRHHPSQEIQDLPPLGSEPRDPTLRVPTSDLIDTVVVNKNTPPAYTQHPIFRLDHASFEQRLVEDERRRSLQLSRSELRSPDEEGLDSPGIVSLGQRIPQDERAQRNRHVRFGGTTEYRVPPPMAWPEDSSTDHEDEEGQEEQTSSTTHLNAEAGEDPWRRTGRQRSVRYGRELSWVERWEDSWREVCGVCFGACGLM